MCGLDQGCFLTIGGLFALGIGALATFKRDILGATPNGGTPYRGWSRGEHGSGKTPQSSEA